RLDEPIEDVISIKLVPDVRLGVKARPEGVLPGQPQAERLDGVLHRPVVQIQNFAPDMAVFDHAEDRSRDRRPPGSRVSNLLRRVGPPLEDPEPAVDPGPLLGVAQLIGDDYAGRRRLVGPWDLKNMTGVRPILLFLEILDELLFLEILGGFTLRPPGTIE